ncbi:HPr(Ser) kinase/phosphatase [Atopobacter phocae]|uniref:HPr(Ser) kinase/phosphatase n=1 Tax=Atopobacter phocae TaxID=136492 RepID=UPI0004BA5132|nr:HPr(Ser) kinase/phosphatase [Atopobacter phocae]
MSIVTVRDLVEHSNLVVVSGEDYLDRPLTTSEIARPGLVLAGYFKFFPKDRIQLFGRTEATYIKELTPERRVEIYDFMASNSTPCFIVARGIEVTDELIEAGEKHHVPVLSSPLRTTRILGHLTNFLESRLAERKSVHGVLVEVFGLGVLITGESGVGKSETALELVQKGHRLVADDRVELYQRDEVTIVGEAPEILSHLLEIRGVGIVDVFTLFGAGAIRDSIEVDLIIYLENWNQANHYDRLGNQEDWDRIFDIDVKRINIPVKTGRNISIIVEAAAMNFRSKQMGFDPMETFHKNLNLLIEKNARIDAQNKLDGDVL